MLYASQSAKMQTKLFQNTTNIWKNTPAVKFYECPYFTFRICTAIYGLPGSSMRNFPL